MSKITLTNLANLQNENTVVSAVNSNNSTLITAMDNTLSRDGTAPNQMLATLDMNSNRIINLPQAIGLTEPLRKAEMDSLTSQLQAGLNVIQMQNVTGVNTVECPTRNQIASTNFSALVQYIRTAGYASVGDGGDAIYQNRGALQPTHAGKVQSLDGQWWEIVGTTLKAKSFGVLADGSSNDTTAAQNVINSPAKVIEWPEGTMMITGVGLVGVSNQVWNGKGKGVTIFKQSSAPTTNDMIDWIGKSNFHVRDLTVDFNNQVATVSGGFGCINCSDFSFRNVAVIHGYKYGFAFNGCSKGRIEKCDILKDTADPTYLNSAILFTVGQSTKFYIEDNFIQNWGVGIEKVDTTIVKNNIIDGYSYGAGISGGGASTAHTIIYSGNMVLNGDTALHDLNLGGLRSSGMEIYCPNSIIATNIVKNNGGDGIHHSGQAGVVVGNVSINNGTRSKVPGAIAPNKFAGYTARYTTATDNCQHSVWVGNVSENTLGSQDWSFYGIGNPNYFNAVGNWFDSGNTTPVDLGAGVYRAYQGPTLIYSFIFDCPSLTNGSSFTTATTAAGAALGDTVEVSGGLDLQGIKVFAWVNAANSVNVRFENNTGSTIDLASTTYYVRVHKPYQAAIY